jgi:hypothetical protein
LVQFYVQKIHESELLFLRSSLTFLERLHINHIARNDIWDKITLHPAPLLPIRLFQHQGLLFDERQLCLFFLAIAQNKRLNGFINSNWDFF